MPDEPRGEGRHVSLGPGREFDLVRSMLSRWGDAAAGLGDDASILEVPPGERFVVSTDLSVEDVHFREEWFTPREIAERAVTAALSDLAAMAATPSGILLALVLPERWTPHLDELASGVGSALANAETRILGGDLTRGSLLTFSVTAIGTAARPIGRGGARPGDRVYVTGILGGPGDALQALGRGETPSAWSQRRFASPAARLKEARWLADRGIHALIDISDGLSSELAHLAAASNVELRVELDRVPVGSGIEPLAAVRSGEEYELLLASPHELDADAFARAFGEPLCEIGRVHASGAPRVSATFGGERVDLNPGHDHFSR